jgi:hypothetical protein
MNVVVSMLFHVMHFPHNRSIVTIDQISSDNHHPNLNLSQFSPLYVPSVQVESSPPMVNYVASYPWCSISLKMGYLQSCSPSRKKVSVIDQVVYPMAACDPLLSHFGMSDHEFPLKSNLIICETSSHGMCAFLSLDFLDVEFP